jgi:hypothetical protein
MLFAIVARGKKRGVRSIPWRHKDGNFHVLKNKGDAPILVKTEDEIKCYLQKGYGVRMGNKEEGHPPGLVKPDSIQGWNKSS